MTKRNKLFPAIKQGGYSCRIIFRDETRGERYFDAEWGADAAGEKQFKLNYAMDRHGSYDHARPAAETIGKSLRAGDTVTIRPRRWTRTRVTDLPSTTIRIDAVETAHGATLITFSAEAPK